VPKIKEIKEAASGLAIKNQELEIIKITLLLMLSTMLTSAIGDYCHSRWF
jgi:hypothetical protein